MRKGFSHVCRWLPLAALLLTGCVERALWERHVAYPLAGPTTAPIPVQVGVENFFDLRTPEEKAALKKIYKREGRELLQSERSLSQLLTARFVEDLRQSSFFASVHAPPEPDDELILRCKLNRFDSHFVWWPSSPVLNLTLLGGLIPGIGGKLRADMDLSVEVLAPGQEEPLLSFDKHVTSEDSMDAWDTISLASLEEHTKATLATLARQVKDELSASRETLVARAEEVRQSRKPPVQVARPAIPALPEGALRGVAVYPFAARGGAQDATAEALGGLFQKEIAGVPCTRIVAEDIIEDLARQQGLEQQCGNETCQIDLASQAQADLLVRGELLKVGETYVLTALMIDLASRQTVFSGDVQSGEGELIAKTRELAARASEVLGCAP